MVYVYYGWGHSSFAGAVGTIEASRVIVGPACGYQIEVYGTDGSLKWDLERMNELQVRIGRAAEEQGYVTVNASFKHGDYAHFQPGPGVAMGFDNLKTIEAKKFLLAVAGGAVANSNVHDAVSAVAIVTAVEASAATGQWQKQEPTMLTSAPIQTFVALGPVDPDVVEPLLAPHQRLILDPSDQQLAASDAAIVRAAFPRWTLPCWTGCRTSR